MPLSTVNVLTITEHLTPDQYLLDAGIPSASIAGNGVNGFNPTGAGGYPWSNPGQSGIDYFPFPQYFSHRIQLTFVFTDQNGIEHPYYYDSGQIAQGQQPQ
jgi:hypothetical protein